jgi:phosphatidate cytidylyltransferase
MPSASSNGANGATARLVAEVLGAEITPRVVSAAILAPAAVVAAYAGGVYFGGLVAVFSLVMAWEWGRLIGRGRFAGEGAAVMAAVAAALAVGILPGPGWGLVAGVLGAGAVGAALGARSRPEARWAAGGVLYIAVPALTLLWLRSDPVWGRACVLWLFAVVWATDIGAYLAGRRFGGPLLAPAVSPRKTWSGAIGGLTAAAAVSLAAAPLAAPEHPGTLVLFGAVLSVAAQAGDLFESAIKRRFEVKDMSQVIPGHGGVFDRVDALLAAAPVAAGFIWSGVLTPWP